jgi:DNA-binding CsgD family transcriptional regulator
MKRTIFLYGVAMCVLIFLLKFLEYRLWVRELSIAHYVGIVAVLFTVLGVWAGRKLAGPEKNAPAVAIAKPDINGIMRAKGISQREFEVLELISKGYSNQEIADKLFISLNTVKTHTSNLFQKLDARRRTQAIEHAKREGLIN